MSTVKKHPFSGLQLINYYILYSTRSCSKSHKGSNKAANIPKTLNKIIYIASILFFNFFSNV